MYSGNALRLEWLDADRGLVELTIDQQGSRVNSIGQAFLAELEAVCEQLESTPGIRGLLMRSAKETFVVGADIFEFPPLFEGPAERFEHWVEAAHGIFNRLENLPFATLAAVNGLALGGGLELALTADARVAAQSAKLGLPEVTLGLCPGWGGTVRTSRLLGVEAALTLMLSGKPVRAAEAAELGLVDRCVADDHVRASALELLEQLANDAAACIELKARKQRTPAPGAEEDGTAWQARFGDCLKPDYPAAQAILETLIAHARQPFEQALASERDCFQRLGHTHCAQSLVGLFINEQRVRQAGRKAAAAAQPVAQAAVLGAGIMGGGIAYQSAVTGTPVVLKDIRQEALDLGIATAGKALDKQIQKGRLDNAGKERCLSLIDPVLTFEGFDRVDLVVEAVVENEAIKSAVLAQTEAELNANSILTSNTSTISITRLAEALERPERFCGMHFFNPVPLMPLVEVIRGVHSSDEAVATAVAYAMQMGKTPIVVNDCPGFLVNRVLFPYFNAFNRLLHEGVDFQRIDRVMEAFGWPMGPAYLADVIGLDTMVHADQVLQRGYPERMGHDHQPIIEVLLEQGSLGQKNGRGFYDYSNGARNRVPTREAQALVSNRAQGSELSDQAIVDRMMIPLCLEAFLCLDEGVVGSPAEVDIGMILGLGFPKFRGGALRHMDHVGLGEFIRRADALKGQGPLYAVPERLRRRCDSGATFF